MIKMSRRSFETSLAALASGAAAFLLAAAAPAPTATPASAPAALPVSNDAPTNPPQAQTSPVGPSTPTPVAATPSEPLPSEFTVGIDQTQTLSLGRTVATISVGNPSIIDVNVQNGDRLFLLGKSFGRTNVLGLDATGKTVLDMTVFVTSTGGGALTVYKGARQLTYNCAPKCERALMPGDSQADFEQLSGQITSKTALGTSAAGRD